MTPAQIMDQLRKEMSRSDRDTIDSMRAQALGDDRQVKLMCKLLIDAHEFSILQLRLRLTEMEIGTVKL